MSTRTERSPARAAIGLAALLIYILACASFSPDDTKVLYSTVEPQTGTLGIAVYDRTARKSDLLFMPCAHDVSQLGPQQDLILRPQWLPDGRGVVVTWTSKDAGGPSDGTLNVAAFPYGQPGPVRLFTLDGLEDGSNLHPLPILGNAMFLSGKSNTVVRLDLASGQVRCGSIPPETVLLPAPGGDFVLYLTTSGEGEKHIEFGTMHPESFARTPRGQINVPGGLSSSPALSSDLKSIAYLPKDEKGQVFHLTQANKPDRLLPLHSVGPEAKLGNGQLSPNGDVLYVPFMDSADGGTNTAFGFVEVPLDGSSLERKTTLLSGVPRRDESDVLLFPIEISHDGKALAASSTYLAQNREIKNEDRALFLTDLADPGRKITRVPVPRPPPPR